MMLNLPGWEASGFFAVLRGVLCPSEVVWRTQMIFSPDFETRVWTLFLLCGFSGGTNYLGRAICLPCVWYSSDVALFELYL